MNQAAVVDKSSKIDGIIFDFDGVWTDNHVWTTSRDEELVRCSKYDSTAFAAFRDSHPGIACCVISSEKNTVVASRCKKLGIDCFQDSSSKVEVARRWCNSTRTSIQNVAFICNDINDIELCKAVGMPIGTGDCAREIYPYVKHRLISKGGTGAVREALNLIASINEPGNGPGIDLPLMQSMGDREWGTEELLFSVSGYYSVKLLKIKKGARGGLQRHILKDECGYIIRGQLLVRYINDNSELVERLFTQGESFRFRAGCIHQEEAVEYTEILECSTPHSNDRVRMEDTFGIEVDSPGLPSTTIQEVKLIYGT